MYRGVRAKIHFFKFFLSLSTQALTNFDHPKNTRIFAPFAQVHPTKGNVFFREIRTTHNEPQTMNYAKQNRNEISHPALKIFKYWVPQFCILHFDFCILKLTNQFELFMQNKPNLPNVHRMSK